MTTRNHRIRFMAENWAHSGNVTVSSAESSFPATNLANDFRFKLWRPTAMTAQWVKVDVGASLPVGFVSLIGEQDIPFAISQGATFKIMGSNIDFPTAATWLSTAPLILDMDWTDLGGMRFLDDQADTSYRYWMFYFDDPDNQIGSFSHIYVGEYITIHFSNVARGFQKTHLDPSVSQESDSGAMYFRSRPKYQSFDNAAINYLIYDDLVNLEQIVFKQGTKRPFYVSFDPLLMISNSVTDYCRFVRFEREPVFVHQRADRFSFTGLSLREVE
jgi:hypothetical protein